MSSFKRKREDFEEDSDEEPTYGRQILPVANLPEDFNEEPMDGMQYLFMVRRDARQLPGTVRVPNPYEKPEVTRTEEIPEARHLPSHLQLPSLEWRELFEHRFQNFRTNFDQPTVNIGPVNPERHRLMPEKKDRDLWWAFLSGKPESEWNPSKRSKARLKKQQYSSQGMRGWASGPLQNEEPLPSGSSSFNNDKGEVEEVLRVDPAETLPSPAGTPAPLDYTEAINQSVSIPQSTIIRTPEQVLVPREPTTQLLKMIDERTALHLLMYFAHWINTYLKLPESDEYLPTGCHARWILSLLLRVDYFISADDMNLLRNLARACLALLKNIKAQYSLPSGDAQLSASNVVTESFCWIIMTTIADVWKQKDLWMEAEDILKSL